MLRKICHIGNSYGVSIPKEILEKLHLTTGTQVEINLDAETNKIIIEPAKIKAGDTIIDPEFASQVKDFIKHYKPALNALAKK
ncbi:MAG: AbrB/MazE/SpoVT family DNA-binding domain-containing protein [Planctomycetes bacterium]|nr:AbrB/MazE/SpoVT family DNA-binding domain-containing protein [Planctomycetota bacterium]